VREPGRTPLLHSVLDWREDAGAVQAITGVRPVELDVATAPFDLSATFRREPDGSIRGGFIYDQALFDGQTIAGWGRSFLQLLRGLCADRQMPIDRLAAVAGEDLSRAVLSGPAVAGLPPLDRLLQASFERHAALPAVETPHTVLSYAELWARSREVPTGPGAVAVIDAADPLVRVVTALAALRGGQAVALIDPVLPPARVERMREVLRAGDAVLAAESDDAGRAAFVQFTSGSTGLPKAAVLSRRGLANLLAAIPRLTGMAPGTRVLQLAAPAFDAWIWEVFTTLAAGATLVLEDRDALRPGPPLAETLDRRAITHATMTPSALAALGDAALPDLRTLISVGEPLSAELADRWAPGRRLLNAYGPCEATICTSLDDCVAGAGTPTIGRPIDGATALVVDRHGQPAIPGAKGELWIAGLGVGLGYLAEAALTAEHFVADPRPATTGSVYRSGDLVRVRGDGRLQFIGRDDRQVKVHGVRIELDEVETALAALPGVEHAAVRAVQDADGRPALAGWVCGPSVQDAARLRDLLAERLPQSMLPAYLAVVDRMPLTATGKVDRGALPDPSSSALAAAGTQAPVGPVETLIAGTMAELLGLSEPVPRHGAFFTLGGHSLLAVRLAGLLTERLGRPVPLPLLFGHPTPAGLAAALASARETAAACTLRPLRGGPQPPAYLLHSVDGSGQPYAALAEAWPGQRGLIAVEQAGDFDDLDTLAVAYAERILEHAGASAPVLLAGWSLGAVIAASVAGRLRGQGIPAAVVLIDAAAPTQAASTPGGDDEALADAARQAGADAQLVERVRRNVALARPAGRLPGAAGILRAEGTPRPGAPPDLGWAQLFDRVCCQSVPGSHMTVLKDDPLAVATAIEALWRACLAEDPGNV
jgi:amino acid adenylation domain-containing protein